MNCAAVNEQLFSKGWVMRWLVFVVVTAGCEAPSERFEGVMEDCDATDVEARAILFLQRYPDGLDVHWGVGPASDKQYTITQMDDAEVEGNSLTFSGDFLLEDAEGNEVVIDHEATLERNGNRYEGTVEIETNITEGTNDCDVVLQLVD